MKPHLLITALATMAVVAALISPEFAQKGKKSGAGSSPNSQRPPFDLNGIWVTSEGEEVKVGCMAATCD